VSAVDWDLLADHLGGALAGTPEGDRVARLIATDPAWAAAAAELAGALDAVAADLRAVGPPPPLPEAVSARLEAALRAGVSDHPPVAAPAGLPAPRTGPDRPPGRTETLAGRSGPGRPGDRRRRRHRWAAALAGVAGVAAFAAIGLGPLGLLDRGAEESDGAAMLAEDHAPPDRRGLRPAPEAAGAAPTIAALPVMTASDLDYQPGSARFHHQEPQEFAPERRPLEPDDDSHSAAARPDPPLARLWDDPAACLAEVEASHVPPPVTVTRMDFARFEGEPAVIVWLTTGDGGEWVQVVGPDCGGPGATIDERHREALD